MFCLAKMRCGALLLMFLVLTARAADGSFRQLSGHVPPVASRLAAKGFLPATNQLILAIGLPLHNKDALGELIRQLYDPQSTNYHKYLTPPEFAARFSPTMAEYQA